MIATGTKFGRYEILSLLGAGGMGEVFLAKDMTLERKVALKVLPESIAKDKDRLRRFEQEAFAASALNHPNILTIYEFGATSESHFIATEFVDGETLRERMRRESFSLREVLDIAVQVAAALNAAHTAGIVHRDIKPENIMLRDDGLVKVLDFGLAKLTGKKPELAHSEDETLAQINTAPGIVMGTVAYMSPEQARGKDTDARSDVWSLGVVLYEMLAGCQPFTGETTTDVLANILHREPPAPLVENTPPELQRIVRKALQKSADERYQTIKDFLLDLKNLKRESELTAEIERSGILLSQKTTGAYSGVVERTKFGLPTTAVSKDSSPSPDKTQELTAAPRKSQISLPVAAAAVLSVLLIAGGIYFGFFASPQSDAPIRSIAVLPFQNESRDQNLDFLSDGISESLIDRLTQMSQLKVIARSSAFKFRGQDALQAAKMLGVRAIVTGQIKRLDNQLAVRVELVDATDNRQLWGAQYNRRADQAQTVQEEIAREIIAKLQLEPSNANLPPLAKREAVKPEAFELLLKGRFALRQYSPESTKNAVEYYRQAIEIEPGYALAYAELAYTYRLLGGSAILDGNDTNPKALAAATKSLELDENMAVARLTLAEIKRDDWDWAAAEREYKRAIELNPGSAEAFEGYALFLSVRGQNDLAVSEMRRARELDPFRPLTNISLGAIFYNARRYEEAIAVLQKTVALDPGAPLTHTWLGIVQGGKGAFPEAVAAYRQAVKLGDDTAATRCFLGYSLAKSGKWDEAREIARRLRESGEFVPPTALAILYIGLDEREQAIRILERAFVEHDAQLQYLNVESHYDSLRSDSRFQNLVRRVGLPL